MCSPAEEKNNQQPQVETDEHRILYLSPESIRSKELESTPASDIWSLGVTLYVLATGNYPFKSEIEIYNAPLSWPIETPLSAEFKLLISSMLHKESNQRPTVKEIQDYQWLRSANWLLDEELWINNEIPPHSQKMKDPLKALGKSLVHDIYLKCFILRLDH